MDESFRSTASIDHLVARAALLRELRAFFDAHGMIEVQTPTLSQDMVIDRHLDPLVVEVDGNWSRHLPSREWYLQTSPEQNMKRLLASGMTAIYQIGPVFRAGEYGDRHNPEFTMAEWYRVGDDFEQGVCFLEQLVESLLHTPPSQRMTYSQAFQSHAGFDPMNITLEELAKRAVEKKWVDRLDWTSDRDDWLDLFFSMEVQERLGHSSPVVVTHFPASQAALARLCPEDTSTAERFEFFYRGIELANGYHELLDANLLRQRNREANRLRALDGKKQLPEESRLLDAMESGLPACCGCALGFDRLVMLATGATKISEVICFPWDRA